jgi:hypothetical protein
VTQQPIKRRVETPWWAWDAIQDTTHFRKVFITGGLGAGKSFGGQIWDIKRCLQNGTTLDDPMPTKSWTVAPNYLICDTLMELTLKVAHDFFGLKEGVHFRLYLTSPKTIDFSPMGLHHELSFRSADNPKHFVSASLTHWRWSEPGVSKADTYEKLMDRLRDERAKVLQGLADGTPEGLNHYADLADVPGVGRVRHDPKRNVVRYIVPTGDNVRNLAPGYLDELRARYAYDKSKLISYEHGLFAPFTKGSAYWEWVESRNVELGLVGSPHVPLLFCWDFNLSPLAWVAAQRQVLQANVLAPRTWRFAALAESSGESRSIMDAIVEFAARFPVQEYRFTPIEVHGDASGFTRRLNTPGSDFDTVAKYLKALGYQNLTVKAPTHNPEIRQRLEKTAALMAYKYLVVSPGCTRLMNGYRKSMLKPGTWDIKKPDGDDWTHWPDALDYGLFEATKGVDVTNPDNRPLSGFSM